MTTDHIRRTLRALFTTGNNAGEGFDPTPEIEDWTCLRAAETTDDVSVYTYTEGSEPRIVLVGTDATGSDDSRWAVRVAPDVEVAW